MKKLSAKRQLYQRSAESTTFIEEVMGTPHDEFLKTLKPGSLRWRLEKVLSAQFDAIVGIIILVNTVVMYVQLEHSGYKADAFLQGSPVTEVDALDKVLGALTHVFNVIFTLEQLLRLYVYRSFYFHSAHSVLDFIVVVVSLGDAYVLPMLIGDSDANLGFVRMLRFLRQGRTLRVIRTMSMFRPLRVLITTITVSIGSLFFSMLTLFIFMLMGALLLCQLSQDVIEDDARDAETRAWLNRYYGTSSKALYTMFEVTFSGGWPSYARPFIEEVNSLYVIFFGIYVTGVIFGMVRIISALFLKDTLQSASKDADMVIYEKMEEARSLRQHLEDLFWEADTSHDGTLDWEEFFRLLSNPRVRTWVSSLGLAVQDAHALFEILDDGSGKIEFENFCLGLLRLKGGVRSQDVYRIEHACARILEQCAGMQGAIAETMRRLPTASEMQGSSGPAPP